MSTDTPKRMESYDFTVLVRGRIMAISKEAVEGMLAKDLHIPIGMINSIAQFGIDVQQTSKIIPASGFDPNGIRR